jgi:plasmid stabilization system protein ParE
MRFTVTWREQALQELAEIWLEAHDRAAVTLAVDTIDAQLHSNPAQRGISVAEGLRKLVHHPVQVYFEVHDADRVVEVGGIRIVAGEAS